MTGESFADDGFVIRLKARGKEKAGSFGIRLISHRNNIEGEL